MSVRCGPTHHTGLRHGHTDLVGCGLSVGGGYRICRGLDHGKRIPHTLPQACAQLVGGLIALEVSSNRQVAIAQCGGGLVYLFTNDDGQPTVWFDYPLGSDVFSRTTYDDLEVLVDFLQSLADSPRVPWGTL